MKKIILLITVFFCCSITSYSQGNLDSSFGVNGIVKTDIRGSNSCDYFIATSKVLVQSDGSMYVISETNGQTIISKRLANGSIDLAYGNNGFSNPINISGPQAALQSDGKIVIGGSALARCNTDGSLDKTFGQDGIQNNNFHIRSVAIQSNNKIVIAGNIVTSEKSDFIVARHNTNGQPDLSFSEDGRQTTDFKFEGPNIIFSESLDFANSVAIANDGKIVVAGYSNNFTIYKERQVQSNDFSVAIYNTDGSLSNKFSKGFGPNGRNIGKSVAIQNDGKIVVAGTVEIDGSDFAIIRYDQDGGIDFKRILNFGIAYNVAEAVAIQTDGKIVVAGYAEFDNNAESFAIARFNSDGTPDHTFSEDGLQTTDFTTGDKAQSISIQSDGYIVVAGSSSVTGEFAIARYEKNGRLDNSFDMDGKLTGNICTSQLFTNYTCTAVQGDGKLVAAGSIIARYNNDGSLDNTFSEDGKQIIDYAISSIAIQNDGKIVVGGSALARYNSDGSPDNTFGKNGKQTIDFNISSLAIQSDGKIVVVSNKTSTGNRVNTLARYNTDGSLDNSFSGDGKLNITLGFAEEIAKSIAIQKDGKIIVAGTVLHPENDELSYAPDNDFAVARYNADGSVDNSFSEDGIQMTNFSFESEFLTFNGSDVVSSVTIQNDGMIVLGGHSIRHDYKQPDPEFGFAVARYNTDGSLNFKQRASFGTNNGPTSGSTSVVLQNDGKILVGGYAAENSALARFNDDGSIDHTFSDDGIQLTSVSNGIDVINAMAIIKSKLYTAGYGEFPASLGVISRYILDDEDEISIVSLTSPTNDTIYIAPAHIPLIAETKNFDAAVKKVQFFSGTTLLATQNFYPYTYTWHKVPAGKYFFTAKAFDNEGNITISSVVHVTVLANKPPIVSLTSPVNNATYIEPAHIPLVAEVKDADGTIRKIQFFNGNTLLATQNFYPYNYTWHKIPEGEYTFTAKATDDKGAVTISKVVKVSVVQSNAIVNSSKINLNENSNARIVAAGSLSLKAGPNPVKNILDIYLTGLSAKRLTISIVSLSGLTIKSIYTSSEPKMRMDVSILKSGVYFLKVISEGKILHTKFVKL